MDALQSEFEKLKLIVEGLDAGLWDWEMQDGQEWWSPRFYELIGFAEGEIAATYDFFLNELLHPDDRPMVEKAVEKHLQKNGGFRLEMRIRHKSGEYRWFESSGKASFDASGLPRRMAGSIVDITENKNLRLELERREALLQEIGFMTQTGGWETDLFSRQTRWSKELLEIVGVQNDFTPTTEKIMDFFAPEFKPVIRHKVREALASGHGWDEELKIITAGQQEVWVRCIGKPLLDASGAVTGLRGVLQNIDDQKLAEQLLKASEEKFRKMFELSPVGMTLIDLESGAILEYNQAFLASTGYSAEETKTLNYSHFTPKEFVPVIRQQVEIMLREGIYGPIEIERIRKDGQRIPVLLNGLLVEDDQGRQMVWSYQQDISEMKRREQRISELNEELKAINEQKDQLFSIISHDLRGSVGNTDLLLDFLLKAGTNFQGEIQELIQNARQSSAIAKSLLEDLLLWARSQMNTIDFKPLRLSLQPIVAQVFASLEAQAGFKHLHLVSDIPAGIAVNADKEMLKVILRNLVSNAIKFSYPEGTIKVMANEKAGMVYISVQDEGMGIAPENLRRLFDNNKHLTTQGTRGEKGSGVGLNLCKEFIKKHGGEITAVSQLKKGTTFTFSLPEAKPDKR